MLNYRKSKIFIVINLHKCVRNVNWSDENDFLTKT